MLSFSLFNKLIHFSKEAFKIVQLNGSSKLSAQNLPFTLLLFNLLLQQTAF